MFLTEFGSVCMKLEIENEPDIEIELKCYPRVIHAIKASGIIMDIPCSNRGMKSKLKLISRYIYETLNRSMNIMGFRSEICMKGNVTLQQVTEIFKSYSMSNGLPEGIEVAKCVSQREYKELIQFVYIEYEHIGRGANANEPSVDQKANMAKLLNCLGLFSTRYEKLLTITRLTLF